MIWIIAAIATILALVGNFFVAKQKVLGFWIWIVSNTLWVIYCMILETYSQIPLWLAYTSLAVYAIYEWNKPKPLVLKSDKNAS